MKKQFMLLVATTLISISTLMAQDASRVRQSPEERTKATMEKFESFNLKTDVRASVETIFNNFYKAQQSAMQDARAAGADRSALMEKRKQLTSDRDAKLKKVLTEEEYNKWISDIEPSLRPQRQPTAAPAPAAN